jgi:PAS domain S-box-containing protein
MDGLFSSLLYSVIYICIHAHFSLMAKAGLRVLFVDDEPDYLTIGRVLLTDIGGYEVTTAPSAESALEILKSAHFDAIVSDYLMKGMNGIDLLRIVRNDDTTRSIAFLLLTGQGEDKVAIEAMNSGVDFYLSKGGDPVSRFTDICHKIAWAVHRTAQGREGREDQSPTAETAYDAVGTCLCHLDSTGSLILDEISDTAGEMLHLPRGKNSGALRFDSFFGLLDPVMIQALTTIAASGSSQRFQHVHIPGTDTIRPLDIQAIQTSPGHLMVTFASAREQNGSPDTVFSHLYRSVLAASPDVIVASDLAGIITSLSPRSDYVFRIRSPDEAIGTPLISWVIPECREQALASIAQLAAGEPVLPMIYRLQRADGSSFPAEIYSSPIRSGGTLTGILLIIRDNSDRVAQYEALERANTRLNLLSSITRHDILNKVTALRLYCSLLEEEEDPGVSLAMVKKVEEMAGIISDLVTFTGYYQNLGIHTAQWIDVGAVMKKITLMISPGRVGIVNGFDSVRVLADPLFEKVLYNLLENALKYGRTITRIETGYELTTDGLILYVADDGVGVASEDKERIFERDFGEGSGLGLFLSREILSVTCLSIQESGQPGQGARFEIRVPHGYYHILAL